MPSIEAEIALDYVETGMKATGEVKRVRSAPGFPNLGVASSKSAGTSRSFLFVPSGNPVRTRLMELKSGGHRYALDQLVNPDTVVFSPGGFWGEDVLLHGQVATVGDSEVCRKLMNVFGRNIRKRFKKIRAFWVGQEAETEFMRGTRLTISADSPKEFGLLQE